MYVGACFVAYSPSLMTYCDHSDLAAVGLNDEFISFRFGLGAPGVYVFKTV